MYHSWKSWEMLGAILLYLQGKIYIGISVAPDLDLLFDYTALARGTQSISLGWDFIDICNEEFELQGYSLINGTLLSNDVVFRTVSNQLDIPVENISIDGMPVFFRLVAVENGSVCSQESTETLYYRFDELQPGQVDVQLPNATNLCIELPTTDICTSSLSIALPQGRGRSAAICTVHNSSFGRVAFESCTDRLEKDPIPQLFENGSVCFTDLNGNANGSSGYFLCSTDPCRRDANECNVNTLLTYYRIIIISEPPDVPQVTLDGRLLCFNAFSHVEVNFNVSATDVTGIPVPLSGSYNSAGPLCLNVMSQRQTPNFCLPLAISILATNVAGTTSSQEVVTSESDQENCDCYQQREQMSLVISSASTDSAVVSLVCDTELSRNIKYSLQDQQESNIVDFDLSCGQSRSVFGLMPRTQYMLVRNYTSQIQCVIRSFQTDSEDVTTTQEPSDKVGVAVGVTIAAVLLVAIIIAVVVAIICFAKKKGKKYNVRITATNNNNICLQSTTKE